MITIRAAGVSDISFIVDLERGCATAAHWSEEQYRRVIQCGEDEPHRIVLIGEMIDCVGPGREVKAPALSQQTRQLTGTLGFLVARQVSVEWELENIVVAPAFRGQGAGSQLLDALFTHVRAADGKAIFLEVRESNAGARRLYERSGFHESGRRRRYYSDPAEDAVLYCKAVV
jgi:[ribosomal protein S18]-alanine N-acetyltransferase